MQLSLSRNYRGRLYHATDFTAAHMIAREGHFTLSFNHGVHEQGTVKWPFYLSTARTLDNPYKDDVIFELDPASFGRGTKVVPFNYWGRGSSGKTRFQEKDDQYKNEFEERVLSTKSTLHLSCVVAVHIVLSSIDKAASKGVMLKNARALMAFVRALRGRFDVRLYNSIDDLRNRRVSGARLIDIARWLKGEGGNVFAKPTKDAARSYVEKAYRRDMEILQIIDQPEVLAERMAKSYKFREQVLSMRPSSDKMDSPLHNGINNLKGGGARERQIGARLLSTMRAKKLFTPQDLDDAIVNAVRVMEDKKAVTATQGRLELVQEALAKLHSGTSVEEIHDKYWPALTWVRSLRFALERDRAGDADAEDQFVTGLAHRAFGTMPEAHRSTLWEFADTAYEELKLYLLSH